MRAHLEVACSQPGHPLFELVHWSPPPQRMCREMLLAAQWHQDTQNANICREITRERERETKRERETERDGEIDSWRETARSSGSRKERERESERERAREREREKQTDRQTDRQTQTQTEGLIIIFPIKIGVLTVAHMAHVDFSTCGASPRVARPAPPRRPGFGSAAPPTAESASGCCSEECEVPLVGVLTTRALLLGVLIGANDV